MKVSEFDRAVAEVFGEAYGRVVVRETVLPELGNRTALEALAAGVLTRDVWLALCKAEEVPRSRWHGAGLPEPRS
jgi:hypothetical protein